MSQGGVGLPGKGSQSSGLGSLQRSTHERLGRAVGTAGRQCQHGAGHGLISAGRLGCGQHQLQQAGNQVPLAARDQGAVTRVPRARGERIPETRGLCVVWLTDFVGWLPMPDGVSARPP